MRILSFILGLIFLISCNKETPLPVSEQKIVSFYTDYFIYTKHLGYIDKYSPSEITNFVLKKNKLTEEDLKKITYFSETNPKAFDKILEKTKIKVDSIFGNEINKESKNEIIEHNRIEVIPNVRK